MNNDKMKNNPEEHVPDADNEEFWNDFNRKMWLMFKKAEVLESEIPDDLFADTTEKATAGKNSRRNCLTFERCAEIGRQKIKASAVETSHIESCRLCARKIKTFGSLPEIQPDNVVVEKTNPEIEKTQNKPGWFGVFETLGFGWLTTRAVWTALIAVLFLGAIVVLFRNFSDSNEQIVQISLPKNENIASINQNSGYQNPPENINGQVLVTNGNAAATPKTKIRETQKNKNADPQVEIPEDFAPDLAFLGEKERDDVWQSYETGLIKPSGDSELLRKVNLRGNDTSTIKLISPQNEATEEIYPEFRWQDSESGAGEYQVTILDRELKVLAKSDVLSQNSWRISEQLSPGLYFWKVLKREKDSNDFKPVKDPAIFKIISQAEKSQIAEARQKVKSHLVTAILCARAGLFSQAERELYAELKQHPNSSKAKRMLIQVLAWRGK